MTGTFLLEHVDTSYVFEAATDAKPLSKGVVGRVLFESAHRADTPTRNGNIYPSAVLEAMCADFSKRITETKGILMNASHPHVVRDEKGRSIGLAEADVSGPRGVAGRIVECKYNKSTGHVSLAVDLLETSAGKDIRAIVASESKIGVSCRAQGSTKYGKYKGMHGEVEGNVLQEGASLLTFDFVADPSVITAWSGVTKLESTQPDKSGSQERNMDLNELKLKHPDLVHQIVQEATNKVKAEMAESQARQILDAEARIAAKIESSQSAKIAVLESDVQRYRSILESQNSVEEDEDEDDEDEGEEVSHPALESFQARLAQLEEENKNLRKLAQKAEAEKKLKSLCEGHAYGQVIFESCVSRVDTPEEAEHLFKFTLETVERTAKATRGTQATGKSTALQGKRSITTQIVESTQRGNDADDEQDNPTSVESRYKRLAGV